MPRPIFTYIERNDNLGLCVIQDILEYAFEDNVFSSPYIKEPLWRYTTSTDLGYFKSPT